MRVRHLIAMPKTQASDTDWKNGDMPPRACPIYPKSKPHGPDWQWRSVKAVSGDQEFWLVATVNKFRGNLKSFLIVRTGEGFSVVGRYEFHSSHPGQHLHAHCDTSGVEVGPEGMNHLARVPSAKENHRRSAALSVSTFWENARRFFRVNDDLGPLFTP